MTGLKDGLFVLSNPDALVIIPFSAAGLLDFSRPGTPTDNAHIESFNGTLRDEFLNVNWFASLGEAQRLAEAWRVDYNESRPHMAHNGKTPAEFAEISGLCHGGQVQLAAGF
ncbi:MAG: transposase [Hyphomonas sp.]|nr:transposase [Hyphomonas sp.]